MILEIVKSAVCGGIALILLVSAYRIMKNYTSEENFMLKCFSVIIAVAGLLFLIAAARIFANITI